MAENASCAQCDVVQGRRAPPGGLVLETPLFVAHALLGPSPIAGWVVLAPRRHARWWYELDDSELAELGPLAARIMRAQRASLGAEHAYAFAIGDVLHHAHLHLVPRYEGTPPHRRGRGAFDFTRGEALPESEIAAAAARLRGALAR